MRRLQTLAFLITAFLLPGISSSQTLDARDQRQIEGLAMMFDAAFESGEMGAVAGFVPQPIIEHVAKANQLEPVALRRMMIQQMDQLMAEVEVNSFAMDTDALIPGETQSGRSYALVPTTTKMTLENGTALETTTQTLFFEDNGNWFLLRLDNVAQIEILKTVYPDFASVEFD